MKAGTVISQGGDGMIHRNSSESHQDEWLMKPRATNEIHLTNDGLKAFSRIFVPASRRMDGEEPRPFQDKRGDERG